MPDFTVRYAKKSELERVNEIRFEKGEGIEKR